MTLQARWVEAVAAAESPTDFSHRMEAAGVFVRVDDTVEPEVWRGATVSRRELDALRQIENVVRLGKVRRVGSDNVKLEFGDLATRRGEIYINCTAAGIRPVPTRPVFHDRGITMQFVTIGIAGWSASTIGLVEALREDDSEKNALCPIVAFTGEASDVLDIAYNGMSGLVARSAQPDIAAWMETCRLNPARGAAEHMRRSPRPRSIRRDGDQLRAGDGEPRAPRQLIATVTPVRVRPLGPVSSSRAELLDREHFSGGEAGEHDEDQVWSWTSLMRDSRNTSPCCRRHQPLTSTRRPRRRATSNSSLARRETAAVVTRLEPWNVPG